MFPPVPALVMIVIYVLTACTWFIYGSNGRMKKIAVIINFCIAGIYIMGAAIKGADKCNSEWLCFKWYEEAFFIFLVHLILFWFFMILHLLTSLIAKYSNPDKNKQQ